MENLINKISSKYSTHSIENKIYIILSLTGIFFAIVSTLINILFHLGIVQIIISISIGIVSSSFMYITQMKKTLKD
jgi:hypothetical protein